MILRRLFMGNVNYGSMGSVLVIRMNLVNVKKNVKTVELCGWVVGNYGCETMTMFEITKETTKAQLIDAINEEVHFDFESLVSDLCWIGFDELDNFWEIKEIVNGDEQDYKETIGLTGHKLFNALKFGSVDFTDAFIKFDGYGNLESFNYPELKDSVINAIERMDEDVFEEFIEEFEGNSY